MNAAIVALIRGYKDQDGYKTLINRNTAVERFFGDKYPLVFFHEGNIKQRDQLHIKGQTPTLNMSFVDISDRWTGGYEGMCRFYAYDLWEVCQYYEYIMRIDEDCILLERDRDPFDNIGGNVYLKSVFFAESHSETNATLPQEIERITGREKATFYNDKFVYTNVSLSSVKFWREGEVADVLQLLAKSKEQRRNRWGDLPMLGSLLNIYAPDRIGTLTGIRYAHMSHANVITCE